MNHKDRKIARRYDTSSRCRGFTERVYGGPAESKRALWEEAHVYETAFHPEKSKYNIYFGELHGHSRLSDGRPTPDEYFQNIRDNAKLDFAALTDHDHGGVAQDELFGEKWEIIKQKVKEYNEPNKFSVILGYERDSYPWYNNMVIYYKDSDGEMLRGEVDGEITREELGAALKRDDLLIVPHDTYHLDAGADLQMIDLELLTPLIEIYSRGDSAEYFGTPYNISEQQWEGGFWQVALNRGAKMGCIAGSDDHFCGNGLILDNVNDISRFPGITGVLAEENTVPAIFDALKKRRCYGFMGGRMWIDFRINDHYMGEEFTDDGDRSIYFKIEAEEDAKLERVTIVKNCRDYMRIKSNEYFVFDYAQEQDTDVYYLRVEFKDGRCGWTSPIWINKK